MTGRSLFFSSLLLVCLIPALAASQDYAQTLLPRTYAIEKLSDDVLVAGASHGLVLYETTAKIPKDRQLKRLDKGHVLLPDSVNDLVVLDGVLWCAIGSHGVRGFRFQNATLTQIAAFHTKGAAVRLTSDSDLLIVSMGVMGVAAYDVSTPDSPTPTWHLDGTGYARTVHIRNGARPGTNELWLANGRSGLYRTPCTRKGPVSRKADTSNLPGDVRWVGAVGPEMLVSLGHEGLCHMVPNRSRGRAPKVGFCIQNSDVIRDVVVMGHWVFAADSGDGVMVIDWSDATNPKLMDRLTLKYSANSLLLDNGRLYVSADAGAVLAFDVQSLLGNRQ